MTAYYNEHDPFAAQWLKNLIAAGHIAPGEVDERDIQDVIPSDLAGFTQCHFFAGIGVWSYALRQAGWPDDRPVWTGSCPCQPFSAAGKGKGVADERHLWPAFFHLIEAERPQRIFGEQVASKDGLGWLDIVQADLEGTGYAFGALDSCAAGFGASHIRQRLHFAAKRLDDAPGARCSRTIKDAEGETRNETRMRLPSAGRSPSRLADAECVQRIGRRSGEKSDEPGSIQRAERLCDVGRVAQPNSDRREPGCEAAAPARHGDTIGAGVSLGRPGPTNGFWSDVDWLGCRDGKWRPVESGTFPLAHGVTNRVGTLRGAGNAIVAPQAQAFIEAFMDWERAA